MGEDVLGGAEGEDVDELRHRQRIDRGAGAAEDDHRVPRAAVAPAQGDAGAVQHLEEVDVVLFEGDREGDAAEVVHRPAGLERDRHADAVREEALARPVRPLVDQLVDALEPQARHADVVAVGIRQSQPVPPMGREPLHRTFVGKERGPVVGGLLHKD